MGNACGSFQMNVTERVQTRCETVERTQREETYLIFAESFMTLGTYSAPTSQSLCSVTVATECAVSPLV